MFWLKVGRRGPDECWPWLGTIANRKGYGRMVASTIEDWRAG